MSKQEKATNILIFVIIMTFFSAVFKLIYHIQNQ